MTLLTRSPNVALLGEQAPPRVNVAPPPTRANAWEDVADLSRSFGVALDEWQEAILRSSMGERSDGTWSAKQVGVSAPRQNGKSQLIVARALAGALLFGEQKIVISAHAQDTARETFGKFLEIRDACPALDERIDKVMSALNREFIKFKNGAVIQFKARTVSGSRGFSSDCLLLDEAQILGMPAWVSINSTMSARPNPQVWLLGTPPTPEDNGEVFTSIRNAALGGNSRTLAWLEWGAEPDDDPSLESTRAKANPAWNTRINHEIVQGEFETYPPERFALDRLGRWLSDEAQRKSVFGAGRWETCAAPRKDDGSLAFALPPSPAAIGVAVSVDRTVASIAAATMVDHGADEPKPFLAPVDRRDGVAWLVAEVKRIQDAHDCAVIIDEKGPTKDLIKDFEDAGVDVTTASLDEYAEACSHIFDAVQVGGIWHPSAPELDEAVAGAAWRQVGDRQVWGRRKSAADVSMLEAATLAMRGAERSPRSVYEERGLVTL